MKVLYVFMGILVGTVISFYFFEKHVDVMRKLTHSMVEDAYYTGCRDGGGNPTYCDTASKQFLPNF